MTKAEHAANFATLAAGLIQYTGPKGYITISPNWDGSRQVVLVKNNDNLVAIDIAPEELEEFCRALEAEGHQKL